MVVFINSMGEGASHFIKNRGCTNISCGSGVAIRLEDRSDYIEYEPDVR